MRAARSLPIPGISRRPAASSLASSCGWLATMSAPLRYARILNGLSFLISRRSAISRRMRAIAWLSNEQPLRLDFVVENLRATRGERLGDRCTLGGRAEAEQTAAPTRAADLRGS